MADKWSGEVNERGIPVYRTSEKVGPTVGAYLDPPPSAFYQLFSGKGRSFLEIGCGVSPVLATNLKSSDIWVGCDPGIMGGSRSIAVTRGEAKVDQGAELVVFSKTAQEVPSFNPDVFLMVAPNPRDIVDGNILPDLDGFLARGKRQTFIVALDTRTIESYGYRKDAKREIENWMSQHGFRRTGVPGDFKQNSRDLGSRNLVAAWQRG